MRLSSGRGIRGRDVMGRERIHDWIVFAQEESKTYHRGAATQINQWTAKYAHPINRQWFDRTTPTLDSEFPSKIKLGIPRNPHVITRDKPRIWRCEPLR